MRQQAQGLWEEEGEQDKEAGERERASRQKETALSRGNKNTMSYRLFFFAIA